MSSGTLLNVVAFSCLLRPRSQLNTARKKEHERHKTETLCLRRMSVAQLVCGTRSLGDVLVAALLPQDHHDDRDEAIEHPRGNRDVHHAYPRPSQAQSCDVR